MGFGLTIKELLKKRNMTIKQLAEKADIPLNTMYSITKRDSNRLDKITELRICKALDISVDDFRGQADDGLVTFRIDEETAALLGADPDKLADGTPAIQCLDPAKAHRLMAYLFGGAAPSDQTKNPGEEAETRLLAAFRKLNNDGRMIAAERVEELTEIPKYTQSDTPHQTAPDGAQAAETIPEGSNTPKQEKPPDAPNGQSDGK